MVRDFCSFLCFTLYWFTSYVGLSQEIEIRNVEVDEGIIKINYNLNDSLANRFYTVRLYSSSDNFLNPLINVTGDVGVKIHPGNNRQIIWGIAKEMGDEYLGEIALEIKGRVYIPFLEIDWFEDVAHLKKKRTYEVTWAGGRSGNVLNFDLLKGDVKVATFPNIANVGNYKLVIPKSVKPGKGYRFRISDTKNSDEVVFTNTFKIERNIPLMLTAGLAVMAGGGGAILLSTEGGTDEIVGPPSIPE